MDKPNSVFSKNLRTLRKKYNETQLELGLILDVGKTAISNYENGHKPSLDIIKKIAKHYNISEDVLMNTKLDEDTQFLKIYERTIQNMDLLKKTTKTIFPLLSNKNSLNNPTFKKAYDLHEKIIEDSINSIQDNSIGNSIIENFNVCIECYDEAFEKYNIIEAYANSLSFLINILFLSKKISIDGVVDLLDFVKGNKKAEPFVKNNILYDEIYSDEKKVFLFNYTDKERKDILNFIVEIMRELRKCPAMQNIVNYYNALCYILDIVSNNYSSALNNTIGNEMMISEAKLNNPYAIKFILVTDINNF